jgi:hypothetical protein
MLNFSITGPSTTLCTRKSMYIVVVKMGRASCKMKARAERQQLYILSTVWVFPSTVAIYIVVLYYIQWYSTVLCSNTVPYVHQSYGYTVQYFLV